MKLLAMTLRSAFRALRRNKMRAGLTILGIVIGVAAVIAMVSIGRGADAAVRKQIASLGTNLLMVVPGATTAAGVRSGWGGVSTLSVADARAIQRECPAVEQVTYFRRAVVQVIFGNTNWSTAAQAATPNFTKVRDWKTSQGEFFSQRDDDLASRVVVIGQTVAAQLFGAGVDPVGSVIRVRDVPLRIVGVLEAKGQTAWGQDQDDIIVVPFRTGERRLMGAAVVGLVDQIWISTATTSDLDAASDQIIELLHERHRIPEGEEDDFTVRSTRDMARVSEESGKVMNNLLLSVASISLLVGGIGIMNILLVSVTERTREIGIRMAVGARSWQILLQFLVEAVMLSMVGGVVGVLVGIAAAFAVSMVAGWPTLISPGAIVGGLLFSGTVGIFFGYYPARKASRLNPVEALRWE